jgi:hypothetical protein
VASGKAAPKATVGTAKADSVTVPKVPNGAIEETELWRDAMQMGGPRAEVLKGPGASVAPYTAWTRASGSCQFSRRLQAPPVGCAAAGGL